MGTERSIKGWDALEEKLRLLVGEEDLPIVIQCVGSGKSKQIVNNMLVKQCGSKRAGELYKKIKPLLKEKKESRK